MRLQNKAIIVTGSTTGIGKAIALRCISEGAKVVIHGLEKDLGEAVMSEAGNDNAVLHIEDITNSGAADRLVDIAMKTFGKLDAVVNNAAAILSSNIETTDTVFLEKVLRINLVAPFALIRAALPYLSKTKGCVLNIGSVNAYSGEPNLLAYSISKGGLMTLTRNAASALGRYLFISVGTDAKVDRAAADRAEVLRARFAPWYYVVSEESVRRIRLRKSELAARKIEIKK